MLHLQRASAGSGKTFALAKTFIRLFISKKKDGKRVLRNKKELPVSLGRIMAVTFTNKATNDMKMRIVEKLAALSVACAKPHGKADYLKDFLKEFNTNRKALGEITSEALKILLLNYSDFRVSTIDSFFQSILHTFTYESNIEDSFNLEIDGDYLAKLGIDSLLDDILTAGNLDMETAYWVEHLMKKNRNKSGWNPFRKEQKQYALYTNLIESLQKLDKEDFKTYTSAKIDDYFNNLEIPFSEVYETAENYFFKKVKDLVDARRKAAEDLIEAYKNNGVKEEHFAGNALGRLKKAKAPFRSLDDEPETFSANVKDPEKAGFSLSSKLKKNELKAFKLADLDPKYLAFIDANNELNEYLENSKEFNTWRKYRKLLPYLYLIHIADKRKQELLKELNTIQISDTNTLLSKIIGEDEVPFIYERVGTQINHYLIDEFQDTSIMQWNNFLPLLKESESHNHDNLIIGDAKQSIYRFRNAEYRLITTEVPKQFSSNMLLTAEDSLPDPKKINTNWRSLRNIVEFNNYIFHTLTRKPIPHYVPADLFNDPIPEIYSDCIQTPSKTESKGYVNIKLYNPKEVKGKKGGNEKAEDNPDTPGFKELGALIDSLHERGYNYRNIAILSRRNDTGDLAVKALLQYNEANPEKAIPFISEESLKIAAAPPVQLIIYLLELLLEGTDEKQADADSDDKGKRKPNPVLANSPVDADELFKLVRNMKSLAIPSLVEALTASFVSEKNRRQYASHLAAFQDVVLEYCNSYPADIRSFLQWWYPKSSKLAIFSSEEAEAVRITTVHKSKGLEYKCVIIPDADLKFSPTKPEWAWVENRLTDIPGLHPLPPFIPVETTRDLEKTLHPEIWEEFFKDVQLDTLNAAYVAFTRAEKELYVYAADGDKSYPIGRILKPLLENSRELAEVEKEEFIIREPYITVKENEDLGYVTFEYGTPPDPKEPEPETNNDAKKDNKEETKEPDIEIESYEVNLLGEEPEFTLERIPSEQIFAAAENPAAEKVEDATISNFTNPLEEGVALHAILSQVETVDDLDRALLKFRTRGLISHKDLKKYREILLKALGSEKIAGRGWFDGSFRVLNERSVIVNGLSHRPDRVMVSPDGTAVILDYKFGYSTKDFGYVNQVREYIDLLRQTGLFKNVEGYLWYVRRDLVQQVK